MFCHRSVYYIGLQLFYTRVHSCQTVTMVAYKHGAKHFFGKKRRSAKARGRNAVDLAGSEAPTGPASSQTQAQPPMSMSATSQAQTAVRVRLI